MSFADDVIRRQTMRRPDRLIVNRDVATMMAVVTVAAGGLDVLRYREVPVPAPAEGEVLLEVLAAGVNPTDVNTRVGWYAGGVTAATEGAAPAEHGGWSEPTPFPLIQGTDCCGRVVKVGAGADERLLGRRALVRPCMRPNGFGSPDTVWLGSDFDGAFAQFVCVPASEVFVVECAASDAELGSLPCAAGTAENMLRRARVAGGEHVLVTGASGGVGAAAVQLAKRRGAEVTAVAGRGKIAHVLGLGADRVLDHDEDLAGRLGAKSVDVVVDNVSGPALAALLELLARGGRYVSSGAVGGPLVTFDKRTFYLNDLTMIGCTAWDEPVFGDVVAAVEGGELRSMVAETFPLERIADAQRELLERRRVGKLVLLPPASRCRGSAGAPLGDSPPRR